MHLNGLRLNLDKMEVLRVGGPDVSGLGNSLSFWGVALTTKSLFCSLGVHLDPALTMETQVASVVRTAYFHLRRIAQVCSHLDGGSLTTLVHHLAVSRLDYCNVLYVGLPLRLMQKLQWPFLILIQGWLKTDRGHKLYYVEKAQYNFPVPNNISMITSVFPFPFCNHQLCKTGNLVNFLRIPPPQLFGCLACI